jgi:hypothetical protein|tara:strand:+ start:334 stop:1104 length:771 start_codon:yes stop_codon:yes gene_type:complete
MAYIGATPAYGVFNRQVVTGDGTTTVYTLDYPVSSATQLMIVLDGIVQEPEYSYTVTTSSGTGKLTFSEAPDNNARASIVYMGRQLLVATQANSSPHIDTFNGTGSQTAFTLTRVPSAGNGANLLVFVEGVYQRYGASYSYTTSGETLTFSAAPNSGTANIQIIQLAESNNTIDTVLDNSITNAKLSLSYSPSHFSGNGSTTAFTITTGHTVNTILVFENGVCLKPTDDYTVSGTTLTMISAPLNGADISVRYLPI